MQRLLYVTHGLNRGGEPMLGYIDRPASGRKLLAGGDDQAPGGTEEQLDAGRAALD